MGLSRGMRRKQRKDKLLRKLEDAEDIAKLYFSEALPAAKNDAKDEAAGEVMVLALWALHADFGFGRDRLMRFVNSIFEFSATVIDERISFKDVLDALSDECKADFGALTTDLKGERVKRVKQRRDFLSTYRFARRISKADREEVPDGQEAQAVD